MDKLIPICSTCSGRNLCPISENEKQHRVSCPNELYYKYYDYDEDCCDFRNISDNGSKFLEEETSNELSGR